ncbi:hypothetical protein [Sediminicurvatus halobius]|uniref:Uncharacterized protein n=1 Tax=Sediminicurvatus halobius TaxID=2182432 RepID=A0A2U2MYA9_9GAMM|nr:hypothetical protein [Spiribacter halobius]PWG61783.1 hypothetical protein DEM34_15060 [Spiribacter halobius]UEX76782.1 hypothetical protein LMH63_12540 [Spiribacter halobius]
MLEAVIDILLGAVIGLCAGMAVSVFWLLGAAMIAPESTALWALAPVPIGSLAGALAGAVLPR